MPVAGYNVQGGRNDWQTPPELVNKILEAFGVKKFDLNPACSEKNIPAKRYLTAQEDGLVQPWGGLCFLNPPYDKRYMNDWMRKARTEGEKEGTTVVCLVYTRSDNKWWHGNVCDASAVVLIKGRINFIGGTSSSTCPSCLVIFGKVSEEVLKNLSGLGMVLKVAYSCADKPLTPEEIQA